MSIEKIIENLKKMIDCDRDMYTSVCKYCSECVNYINDSERTETMKSALEELKVTKEISDFDFDMKIRRTNLKQLNQKIAEVKNDN